MMEKQNNSTASVSNLRFEIRISKESDQSLSIEEVVKDNLKSHSLTANYKAEIEGITRHRSESHIFLPPTLITSFDFNGHRSSSPQDFRKARQDKVKELKNSHKENLKLTKIKVSKKRCVSKCLIL